MEYFFCKCLIIHSKHLFSLFSVFIVTFDKNSTHQIIYFQKNKWVCFFYSTSKRIHFDDANQSFIELLMVKKGWQEVLCICLPWPDSVDIRFTYFYRWQQKKMCVQFIECVTMKTSNNIKCGELERWKELKFHASRVC